MEKNKTNILIYLLMLMPIIDVLTSLITRFAPNIISIGVIVKGILSIVCVGYILFKSKSEYRKKAIISLLAIGIFAVIYLLTKIENFVLSSMITEGMYFFKYFYLFIMFWGLLNIFDDYQIPKDKVKKIMVVNSIIYILIFILSFVTNSGFSSYADGHSGTNGWFYAANEVGATLTILFPIIYLYFRERKNYLPMLLMIPFVFTLSLIGTKVTLLGLILNLIIVSILYLKRNKSSKKKVLILLIIIGFSTLFGLKSSSLDNVETQIEDKILTEENDKLLQNNLDNKLIIFIQQNEYIHLLFSSRQDFFINTYLLYDKSTTLDKIMGLGFTNREIINSENIEKLIEIDALDIYFHYGPIGFILYFSHFAYIMFLAIFKGKNKSKEEKAITIFEILMICGISTVAGHVFGAPAVSIFIVYYLLVNLLPKETKVLNDNKINILALHLSFGGVESSITSQANALCNNYDVEIVSIYKMTEQPAFKIDKKVKITYLTDLKPNREEFKKALKNKKFLTAFKEGLKSIKILYLKKHKMIEAIQNSDAKIMISSRVEIAELLSDFKNEGTITITEEHCHHNNNKKYINRLRNACDGIDYLVCVSKELTNFYKKEIPHTKPVYIPNGLDYTPTKFSKLNNKNLISVGRLSPEKGYLDLINVFNELHKLDKEYHLDIIGDGNERKAIENKINELKLNKFITLHGFQNKEFINKRLLDSSLYLMCSHEESFGIVLIEAGSFGVPQIAFDSAQGAHEIIENNRTGYLIKNRNSKEFATKAHELLKDRKQLKEFGSAAHDKAMKFSFDNIKKEWLEFIKSL